MLIKDTIEGYKYLLWRPLSTYRPQQGVFSQEQAALVQEEVDSFVQKRVISLFLSGPKGFYSTLLLGGSCRVHDQFRELAPFPIPRIGISRPTGGFPGHSTPAPQGKIEADPQKGIRALPEGETVSPSPLLVHREAGCSLPGYPGNPSLSFYRALQGELQSALAFGGTGL